jgi:hypothetical protein
MIPQVEARAVASYSQRFLAAHIAGSAMLWRAIHRSQDAHVCSNTYLVNHVVRVLIVPVHGHICTSWKEIVECLNDLIRTVANDRLNR